VRRKDTEAAGVSAAYLSEIESGKKKGDAEAMAAMAQELGLSLDDVVHE
jgi:transcriptional regulator with XRE-family HTH domain